MYLVRLDTRKKKSDIFSVYQDCSDDIRIESKKMSGRIYTSACEMRRFQVRELCSHEQ